MYRNNVAYAGFGAICGFRHPLEVLECIPVDKGGDCTCILASL